MWKNHVPSESFHLLQGADNLTHYRFGEGSIDHTFCKTCGMYPFVVAHALEMGGDFFCVNISCLDDVTPGEFEAAPIRYENGLEDEWGKPPESISYL